MIDLRMYQHEALEKLRQALRDGARRVMLYSPTGSGKTEMAMSLIRAAAEKGTRVSFVVNRTALVHQASRRFQRGRLDHGIIQAENTVRTWMPTLVCSIQTLAKRGMPDSGLVVVDEAHAVAGSKAYHDLLAASQCPVIGLSATPFAHGLGNHFDAMVVATTIRDLIDSGFLVDVDIYAPSKPDLAKVRTTGGDYNLKDLGEAVNKPTLIGDMVTHWRRLAEGVPTVCFATDIAHSRTIKAMFNAQGIPAEHIDAYTEQPERDEAIRKLVDGEIKVLTNVGVLAEGWDCPTVGAMILARPTKSLGLYIQMAGRVLRPAPGKTRAIMLDHSGTAERLGFPTDDLPLELKKSKARGEREPKPRPERLPKVCPSCAYVKPLGVHKCPECGFEPAVPSGVATVAGTLEKKARHQLTPAARADVYAQLVHYANQHGYKPGWAYHKLHAYSGRYPPSGLVVEPKEPTPEILRWIKSQQVRYAHSKAKATPKTHPNG